MFLTFAFFALTILASAASPPPAMPPGARGVIVDDVTGRPIAGATVIISGTTLVAGATPPADISWPSATSAADGSFEVDDVVPTSWTVDFSPAGARYPIYDRVQWIEIFSPDGHAAYHGIWSLNSQGTTDLGRIAIAKPGAADEAWLAQINSDRAKVGIPAATAALSFDSLTLESARYWVKQMASYPFFSHQCPSRDTSCEALSLWQAQHHAWTSSQNIAWHSFTWATAEQRFMSEMHKCRDGNWTTCPFSEATGHYINIMSATCWAGVGSAVGRGDRARYYVENFTSPQQLPPNVEHVRTLLRTSF